MTAPGVIAQKALATAAVPFDPVSQVAQARPPGGRAAVAEPCICFGLFQLFPRRPLLLRSGQPIPVGATALHILMVLAERRGNIVSKKELADQVWPGMSIDDGRLRAHILALRKALDDGSGEACTIKTIAGRGYCLIAPDSRPEAIARPESAPLAESSCVVVGTAGPASQLPHQVDRTIGRTGAIRAISGLLEKRRFVTVLGPGGVGKTTIAISVGHDKLAAFAGAVHLIDLGQITQPRLLPGALGSALGLSIEAGDPTPELLELLRDRRALLIFDSCEHLIDPVATLIEEILREAPQVTILATSRERLRLDGEYVCQLSPLDCPSNEDMQSAERVLSFAAPRLFVNRVTASGYAFELTDANAPVVAGICRRLDGLALAIDVAAARVQTFGLASIPCSLDTGAWLLWRGRRTALPRHQTVGATIDWSYNLLSEAEQAVLRSLAVFKGFFNFDAACQIARRCLPDPSGDLHIIDSLVAKSLLSFEVRDGSSGYRLNHSTRAFALEKLRQRGEVETAAAQSFGALLSAARRTC